ncbi:hypothetical protein IJ384_06630 [bacterium]|nr:hypothetical protein [bacterium]
MSNNRWYDIDPTVSLAVSLMRNANIMAQYKCADLIIKKSKEFGLDLSENIITDAFNYVLRRWYDTDQKIAEAFEYLKLLPTELQKETALELISLLQQEETK